MAPHSRTFVRPARIETTPYWTMHHELKQEGIKSTAGWYPGTVVLTLKTMQRSVCASQRARGANVMAGGVRDSCRGSVRTK